MGEPYFDADLAAVQQAQTPPQQLADIAARRVDLHPLILGHPWCYPELRTWIEATNAAQHPQPAYNTNVTPAGWSPAPAPAKRGGGCFVIGCAGIAVVGVILTVGALVLGGLLSTVNVSSPSSPGDDTTRAEVVAEFDVQRSRFYELSAQLDGNPVASLVTNLPAFRRWEKSVDDPTTTAARVAELVVVAQQSNAQLEQRIADAATRVSNASGSVTEGLVDEAGRGFIDIAWDAATACGTSRRADEGRVTVGCVSTDPLGVHLAPEAQLGGDAGMRQVVLHELAHLYMRADQDSSATGDSRSFALVEQGYFQGSSEVFADCYALTYLDLWTLTFDGRETGYGYICNDEERALMRTWAAEMHVPMPG